MPCSFLNLYPNISGRSFKLGFISRESYLILFCILFFICVSTEILFIQRCILFIGISRRTNSNFFRSITVSVSREYLYIIYLSRTFFEGKFVKSLLRILNDLSSIPSLSFVFLFLIIVSMILSLSLSDNPFPINKYF